MMPSSMLTAMRRGAPFMFPILTVFGSFSVADLVRPLKLNGDSSSPLIRNQRVG